MSGSEESLGQGPTRSHRGQRQHWTSVFAANAEMYGTDASQPSVAAAARFSELGVERILELGAGQGRDTLYLARQGFEMVAGDYAENAVDTILQKATSVGLAHRVSVVRHDARDQLPFAANAFDASYSHMLFNMALTTAELQHLAAELLRVVRPDGVVVYTVRHKGDAHYGAGTPRGDDMFENGGFVVHFFDHDLVLRLASVGFEINDITEFSEGDLPRRLWRVTMSKPA
jgi:SAM-dependent methyltransferase